MVWHFGLVFLLDISTFWSNFIGPTTLSTLDAKKLKASNLFWFACNYPCAQFRRKKLKQNTALTEKKSPLATSWRLQPNEDKLPWKRRTNGKLHRHGHGHARFKFVYSCSNVTLCPGTRLNGHLHAILNTPKKNGYELFYRLSFSRSCNEFVLSLFHISCNHFEFRIFRPFTAVYQHLEHLPNKMRAANDRYILIYSVFIKIKCTPKSFGFRFSLDFYDRAKFS